MSSDLWANVASGAVGGVLALAGSGLSHFLTSRKEARERRERREQEREQRLRSLYIDYLEEMNRFIVLFVEVMRTEDVTEAIKSMWREAYGKTSARTTFELQLTETDATARLKVKAVDDAMAKLMHLFLTSDPSHADLVAQLGPAVDLMAKFERWTYATRFPALTTSTESKVPDPPVATSKGGGP